jgi:hypothetical protein
MCYTAASVSARCACLLVVGDKCMAADWYYGSLNCKLSASLVYDTKFEQLPAVDRVFNSGNTDVDSIVTMEQSCTQPPAG